MQVIGHKDVGASRIRVSNSTEVRQIYSSIDSTGVRSSYSIRYSTDVCSQTSFEIGSFIWRAKCNEINDKYVIWKILRNDSTNWTYLMATREHQIHHKSCSLLHGNLPVFSKIEPNDCSSMKSDDFLQNEGDSSTHQRSINSITSDRYTKVLSHTTTDSVHFNSNHPSISSSSRTENIHPSKIEMSSPRETRAQILQSHLKFLDESRLEIEILRVDHHDKMLEYYDDQEKLLVLIIESAETVLKYMNHNENCVKNESLHVNGNKPFQNLQLKCGLNSFQLKQQCQAVERRMKTLVSRLQHKIMTNSSKQQNESFQELINQTVDRPKEVSKPHILVCSTETCSTNEAKELLLQADIQHRPSRHPQQLQASTCLVRSRSDWLDSQLDRGTVDVKHNEHTLIRLQHLQLTTVSQKMYIDTWNKVKEDVEIKSANFAIVPSRSHSHIYSFSQKLMIENKISVTKTTTKFGFILYFGCRLDASKFVSSIIKGIVIFEYNMSSNSPRTRKRSNNGCLLSIRRQLHVVSIPSLVSLLQQCLGQHLITTNAYNITTQRRRLMPTDTTMQPPLSSGASGSKRRSFDKRKALKPQSLDMVEVLGPIWSQLVPLVTQLAMFHQNLIERQELSSIRFTMQTTNSCDCRDIYLSQQRVRSTTGSNQVQFPVRYHIVQRVVTTKFGFVAYFGCRLSQSTKTSLITTGVQSLSTIFASKQKLHEGLLKTGNFGLQSQSAAQPNFIHLHLEINSYQTHQLKADRPSADYIFQSRAKSL